MQEEEEDSEEEVKRLEDSLEALAILKDYTSPWPVDDEGRPVTPVAEGVEVGARGEVDVRSSTAPPTIVGSPASEASDRSCRPFSGTKCLLWFGGRHSISLFDKMLYGFVRFLSWRSS